MGIRNLITWQYRAKPTDILKGCLFLLESVTTILYGVAIRCNSLLRSAEHLKKDDDIVYTPNKYRETEGTNGRERS